MKMLGFDPVYGLLVLGLSIVTSTEDNSKPRAKRYADKPFPKHNIIFGRNVTCGDTPANKIGRFVSHTWTCRDIRVNNHRIAYDYYPGMGVDNRCNATRGKHEFAQLCRELLKKIDSNRDLHALYVPETSCDYSDSRVFLNKTSMTTFEWKDLPAGNGWINTIQCMVVLPKSS